jgi:hypothetical protein
MNMIVEFYPQENSLFLIFFEPFIIFQEIAFYWKIRKRNGLILYCAVVQPAKRPGPTRHARAQPPRPQRGSGSAKRHGALVRLGRRIKSDGRPTVSLDKKPRLPAVLSKP